MPRSKDIPLDNTLKRPVSQIDEISVFFPCYNEEPNIKLTVEKASAVLQQIAKHYEIIVINDGSKDKTEAVAKSLAEHDPHIRVISQPNGGYGAALRAGFYNAKFDPIVYTDADGQFDFREVDKFLNAIQNADAVWGYRIKRMDPPIRLLYAWGWKTLIWIFFGVKIRDVDCGFKMIRRSVLDSIPILESTRGGMINPELLIKINKAGLTFEQVGVNHYPRRAGQPTGSSIQVIITSFIELNKLWWKIRLHKSRSANAPN